MTPADWTGRVGQAWAGEWRRTDRSFAGLDPALERAILAAASPGGGRLVDLGCGAGTTSLAVARARPTASVTGLDLSPDLIAVAAARRDGAGLSPERCRFVAGDAVASATRLAPIDLFFSRHGVMFFDDPVAAFARLAEAGAPGALLVFSCFAAQADNHWATRTAGVDAGPRSGVPQPGPFAFADPERVAAILAAAGWHPERAPERIAFRYVAGAGADPVADAVSFFTRIGPAARGLREADAAARPALLERLAATCARHCRGGEVAFAATAWLWSARLQEKRA
jgi:SAM-dependent methyltransferase